MPRVKRASDEPVFDAVTNALDEMRGRSVASRDAGRVAKFGRRLEKARQRWDRMTPAERIAWTESYLAEQHRRYTAQPSVPRRESERRDLFAITHVAERNNRRAAKDWRVRAAEKKAAEDERRSEVAARRAAEPVAMPVSRVVRAPSPDTDEKPKRRRRGPAVGSIGYRIPGDPRLYDDDDDR